MRSVSPYSCNARRIATCSPPGAASASWRCWQRTLRCTTYWSQSCSNLCTALLTIGKRLTFGLVPARRIPLQSLSAAFDADFHQTGSTVTAVLWQLYVTMQLRHYCGCHNHIGGVATWTVHQHSGGRFHVCVPPQSWASTISPTILWAGPLVRWTSSARWVSCDQFAAWTSNSADMVRTGDKHNCSQELLWVTCTGAPTLSAICCHMWSPFFLSIFIQLQKNCPNCNCSKSSGVTSSLTLASRSARHSPSWNTDRLSVWRQWEFSSS